MVTPLWPNLVEIPKILSANVACVPLSFAAGAWTLWSDRLLAALTPDARIVMVGARTRHAAVAEPGRDSRICPPTSPACHCHSPPARTLDLDRLLAALTPDTRIVMINSPNNPTGWTLTRAEQQAILDHCRRYGIWLVADDVYERLYYRDDTPAAPSFLDLAGPEERVIGINSFSKSWLMTGGAWGGSWRRRR